MDNKNMLYRGFVELLVLKLLSTGDCYGLELIKTLKDVSDDVICLSVGTLYPTLYKMIEKGYITDYKKQTGERKVNVYYHLEESGKERLNQLLTDYNEITNIMNKVIAL